MKSTSIIRERGQLTIPDTIRDSLTWLYPLSAVDITICDENTVMVSPHAYKKQLTWSECIQKIELAQTFPSDSKVTSDAIISADRQR